MKRLVVCVAALLFSLAIVDHLGAAPILALSGGGPAGIGLQGFGPLAAGSYQYARDDGTGDTGVGFSPPTLATSSG